MLGGHAAGAASQKSRAAARLLQLAGRLGLPSVLLRDQVSLVTHCDELVEMPVHGFLAEVLGRRDFVISLRLAPGRPNGKPVIQAVAQDGAVLAYAKFGWEGLTRRLVRREAAAIVALAPLTRGLPLHVPRILYAGAWGDLEALVLAPLSGMGRTPRSPADVPVAASVALAATRPRIVGRLGDTRFWRRTAGQAAEIAPLLSGQSRQLTMQACDFVETTWGDVEVVLGQSHGDWIPPIMSIRADGAFNVWDWERSRADMPLGVDAVQFILFLELQRRQAGRTLAGRLDEFSRRALSRHGLDHRMAPLLITLSLLGSILWFGEAREAGRTEKEDDRFSRALEIVLDTFRETISSPRAKLGIARSVTAAASGEDF